MGCRKEGALLVGSIDHRGGEARNRSVFLQVELRGKDLQEREWHESVIRRRDPAVGSLLRLELCTPGAPKGLLVLESLSLFPAS